MELEAFMNPFASLKIDLDEEVKTPTQASSTGTDSIEAVELQDTDSNGVETIEQQSESRRYGAEKLRRQTERINQTELAIGEVMKSKGSGRASRSKKWTPFDFRDTHSRDVSPIPSELSLGGTTIPFNPTAQVFQPIPINLPIKDASFANLQDRACAKSSEEAQWVVASRVRTGGLAGKDENHNPSMSTPYNKREINEVFGNQLPSPTYCASHPGNKNGQVVFCIHPNGDVSAQQWSDSHYQWVNIGQYSNSRKKTEGQLASIRIRGESETLSLQQSTLAYFHASAKQREADVMGTPFGLKDLHACMPNVNLRRTEQDEHSRPPIHAPIAPAAHYKGLPKPMVALPKQIVQKASPQSFDTSTLPQSSPREQLQRRGEYLRQMAETQSRIGNLTFGSITYPRVSESDSTSRHRDLTSGYPSVVLPQYGRDVVYNLPLGSSSTADASYFNNNTPKSPQDAQQSIYSAQTMHAFLSGADKAVPSRRLSTKPYPPEGLHRYGQINGARSADMNNPGSMQHIPEQELYSNPEAYERYLEEDYYQNLQLYSHPESPVYTRTPGRVPQERGLTREVSYSSIHELGATEPEAHHPTHHFSYLIHPSEISRLQDPPTPQYLDGRSVGRTSQDSLNYDRKLSDWFHNTITTDRHANLYNALMSQRLSSTPTRPSKARDPGVIGPPSTKSLSSPSSGKDGKKCGEQMLRHDSSTGAPSSSSAWDAPGSSPRPDSSVGVQMDKHDTTRVLIPLLENLKGYREGPTRHRRGHWAPFVPPPEWAVDKGMNGNLSFYEEDWGRVPERIGRDWRYRDMVGGGGGMLGIGIGIETGSRRGAGARGAGY